MSNCIFCNIANKIAPAEILFENERIIAFLDINPINFGHTLVITKEHFKEFHEIPEELSKELIVVVSKITKAIREALNPHGYNVFTSNGRIAGQTIMHCHFHILPRYFNDGFKMRPKPKSYKKNELKQYGELIRGKIKN